MPAVSIRVSAISAIFSICSASAICSAAGHGRRTTVQRGSDLRYDLEISLEEAATGKEEKLRIPRLETCDECSGSGAEEGHDRRKLRDLRRQRPNAISARIFQRYADVPELCGQGTDHQDRRARTCRGEGRIEKEKTLEIKIPAGVETGSRLRVSGEGEAGVGGGPSGDLFVVLHVAEHEHFERQGANLYSAVPITFAQAALGAEIKVKTLDGEEDLKIPAGTQTGSVFG